MSDQSKPKAGQDWWIKHEHLSDVINSETWYAVLRHWDDWRQKGYRLFFRGEASCLDHRGEPYPLLPSLLRKKIHDRLDKNWGTNSDVIKLERQILDHYIRHTAHLMEREGQFGGRTLEDLEVLCLAQHYGLPTRLLDWTLNPFIALYFALAGSWRGEDFSAGEPSRLWVTVLKNEHERKDRTIHLERKHQEDEWITDIIRVDIKSNVDSKSNDENQKRKQKWIEDAPFIVVPLVFTQRIAAQSGRFIYCPNLKKTDDRLDKILTKHVFAAAGENSGSAKNEKLEGLIERKYRLKDVYEIDGAVSEDQGPDPWAHLICYPIERDPEETLLKQLEFRGYHSGHLFPDLGGWATYLRQGFR
jgi:hypothetical protein